MITIAIIIIARIKRTAITADTAIPAMMLSLRLESAEDGGISVISTTLEGVGDRVSVGEDIQHISQ